MTVTVVVDEGTSSSPASRTLIQQPRLLCYVRESSVPIIAIQAILPEVGAEDIVEAIVVVVAHADAICPASGLQSRLFGDICERSVAIVFVQTIRSFRRISFQPCA